MKHFLVLMVLCGGIIAIIAYHVGASNNYLSTTQTTFSDLSSSNHANQLKVTMRDAMINKLSHWAQNHETRLQVHAQSTTHPNLTNDQLSFSSFLSSKNNNMLTAQMRDGLVGRFTTVLTNHEMRLRCIQDGSCLKTGATVTPPVKEVYHCVGDYRTRQRNRCQPHPDREMITACLRRDVVESLGSPSPEFYGGSDIRGYWSSQGKTFGLWYETSSSPEECPLIFHSQQDADEWMMAGARGYQGDRYGGLIQMIGCYGGKVSPSQPDMHFGIGDDITHQNLRLFALTMRERCKRAIHWCGDYSSSHTCNEDTYCQWDNGWDTAPCADLNEVSCKGKQSQGCSWVKK